ncbi:MAG: hypothetical protein ABIH50_01210 [bacterium]
MSYISRARHSQFRMPLKHEGADASSGRTSIPAIPHYHLRAPSVLLQALTSGIDSLQALHTLYSASKNRTVTLLPDYPQNEFVSGQLLQSEVLDSVCGGRYRVDLADPMIFEDRDPKSFGKINYPLGRLLDIIKNMYTAISLGISGVKRYSSLNQPPFNDARIERLRKKYEQIKLIEDWFSLHPSILEAILFERTTEKPLFQSVLMRIFYTHGSKLETALKIFFTRIDEGNYQPFFKDKDHVDRFFKAQVLSNPGLGCIFRDDGQSTLERFSHIIRNVSTGIAADLLTLKDADSTEQDKTEARKSLQDWSLTLQVIEDFLFHHPEIRQVILSIIENEVNITSANQTQLFGLGIYNLYSAFLAGTRSGLIGPTLMRFVVKAIKQPNYQPFYTQEEAAKLFSQEIDNHHNYGKATQVREKQSDPDLFPWVHIINNISNSLITNDPATEPNDKNKSNIRRIFQSNLRKLKIIEAYLHYNKDVLAEFETAISAHEVALAAISSFWRIK